MAARRKRGKLIVVEGPDGAGKTTLCRSLSKVLGERGLDVVLLREPGGVPLSEQIRVILKGATDDHPLDERAETLLFCAARAQLCRQVIEPALAEGKWVLLDRFHGSTIVYQGILRGLGPAEVAAVSRFATAGLPDPDLTLILEVSPQTARSRIEDRAEASDRLEHAALEHLEAVIAGYAGLEGTHISGEGEPAEVLARALAKIDGIS